ncbi:MAG TPA: L-seryl-tRNA(Sec) selenium transferase [Terriglobales bacterium]|nr:L-seryl-tRNA(Sec) selenium transferase [Terriglobales bacterium]
MPAAGKSELYRLLPAVDEVLRLLDVAKLVEREGHVAVTEAARAVLARVRQEIAAGSLNPAALELAISGLPQAIERQLRQALQLSLRPLINATGVILHTNLGRAPLASAALDHLREVASAYSNLEFDIPNGERGKRDVHVERLFARMFAEAGDQGAVASVVVNNNAAAVLLALNTLAEGGEVLVSRGELVEIGGSFRVPEIMAKSGAILREVGTTNRTRIADYARAVNQNTRLLLRVHRSNFQITGFTEQPALSELVELGRKRNIPVMEDLGSGALIDLRSVGISGEPGVADSLRAGVDVVTYSGDKLLGGPQAGLLSGRRELVAQIRSNPLFRALRVDKLTYAALEATLLAYLRQDHDAIPTLRMLRIPLEALDRRIQAVQQKLEMEPVGFSLEIVDGRSLVGGGAAPAATLPTRLLAISREGLSADELAAKLRSGEPPVIARVEEGRVLLDFRTVFPEQDGPLARALAEVAK